MLAERTGIPVVSNFRARDIAAGGQGAPLVPFVDYLLFRHRAAHPRRTEHRRHRQHHGDPGGMRARRCGRLRYRTRQHGDRCAGARVLGGKLNCDRGGRIAASGNVNRALLDELLSDAYYRRKPPKSAGREQYGVGVYRAPAESGAPLRDLIATATVLTAATIASAVRRAVTGAPT